MEFSDFIQDYTQKVKVTKETGHWDHGDWVQEGPVSYYINVAILYMTPEDIEYYTGGNYTAQDIKIFAPEDLQAENIETGEKITFTLKKDDIIEFDGKKFKIKDDKNNTILSDFYNYAAKKVVVE